MPNSVYKVTEIVGTSTRSWEDATKRAVQAASKTLRDLRIAEVSALDVTMEDGKVKEFRSKVKLSFKIESAPTPRRRRNVHLAQALGESCEVARRHVPVVR